MVDDPPALAVTMGDPAGVGPEVVVDVFPGVAERARPIVIGDATVISDALERTESSLSIRAIEDPDEARFDPTTIDVLDLGNVEDHEYGVLRAEYGQASFEYVDRSIDLALAGEVDGIVTAPVNKQAWARAGLEHRSHTELIADRTGTGEYTMLLLAETLRVSHVCTHVPFREIPHQVTEDRIRSVGELTAEGVEALGLPDPTIAVAGLNPHAGDGGLFGDEEATAIEPAVTALQADGIDAVGPVSPDTVFPRALDEEFDAVIAMYHDQGHIPAKLLGFRDGRDVHGVTITLGLPIVRTSVDHGTAFDIAGDGTASSASMVESIETAMRLIAAR